MEEATIKTNYLSFDQGKYLYLTDYNQVINAELKDMFLEHGVDRKIAIKEVPIDEEFLKEKIKEVPQLIFAITENCNLRCKYCIFGGNYQNERELSSLNMSFDIARKAIDYLFSIIKDREKKEFFFSFYGGEPLLNFKTIRKTVAYVKERFPDWICRYNLTSNLTILDNEALDFLIENGFSLLVSLDGDKNNHDAKRVFADGSGSHNRVMKNLERIRTYNPDYFDKKVRLSAVFSSDLPLKNLYNFFTTQPLIKQKSARLTPVNSYNTSYYEENPFDREEAQKDLADLHAVIMEKVRREEELTGIETYLFRNFKSIGDSLEIREDTDMVGSCFFNQRLYLDARGEFHMCERVNNTFSFGNIDKGFDYKKMAAIANQFKEVVKDHCSDCNVRFLCSRCYIHFCGDGVFRPDPAFCNNQKRVISKQLERYIKCKEEKLV